MNVELKCEYCGIVFIHTHKIRFCSFKCIKNYGDKLRSEKALVSKICKTCGNEFKIVRCKSKTKYCSKKCRCEDHYKKRIPPKVSIVTCKYCKNTFEVRNCLLEKGEGKFCSKECIDLYRSEKKIKSRHIRQLESLNKKQRKEEEIKLKRTIICKYCKEPFVKSTKTQQFCSNRCRYRYNLYTSPENYIKVHEDYCKYCKKLFWKKHKHQIYCSRRCSGTDRLNEIRRQNKLPKLKRDANGRFMKKEKG